MIPPLKGSHHGDSQCLPAARGFLELSAGECELGLVFYGALAFAPMNIYVYAAINSLVG